MPDKKFHPDGYCGLYCASCPNFLATKNETINEFMKETGLTINQATCYGCKSDINPEWCFKCNLKACARDKGFEFCYQCNEYPCKDLENFKNDSTYPYHQEVYDYMKIIDIEGKDAWLKKMKIRWSCLECKKEASWWDTSCKKCGQKLNGYKKP